jgi:hypothetical protein
MSVLLDPQGLTDLLKPPSRVDWKSSLWNELWPSASFGVGDRNDGRPLLGICFDGRTQMRAGACNYKVIQGITRDNVGNPLGGVTVDAYDTLTDIKDATTISDPSGNYVIYVPTNSTHYLVGYLAGSPDLAGTTQNILVGV